MSTQHTFQTILLMLGALAGLAVLARRLNIAPSILLVATGIGAALIPGRTTIELAPEVVLLMILPPLIYSAAVAMSWREFRANLRPIALLVALVQRRDERQRAGAIDRRLARQPFMEAGKADDQDDESGAPPRPA